MVSNEKSDTVPALRRAVQILDLVAAAGFRMTAAEITRGCGLPKSSAHHLIQAMTEMGLLTRSADGTHSVGAHTMRWANSFLSTIDVVGVFQSRLARTPSLDGHTITLTVREGAEVVYIGCRSSDRPLGHIFRIGMRLPAPFTATGKILLSDLDDAALETLFADGFPAPLTSRGTPDVAHLQAELKATRTRGYSIDDGHIREGMICIGAAIRDHTDRMVAGVAVSLLRSEISAETPHQMGLALQAVAADISRDLGGSGRPGD